MKRKRHSPAQIAQNLRQIEADLSLGMPLVQICQHLGVSAQTVQRWMQEYGSPDEDPAVRAKKLENENRRLRRTVAKLELDKRILSEAVQGNF